MNITPVEPPCKLGWLDVRLPDEAIDGLNDYISKAPKVQPPSLTVPYSKDNPMAWEKTLTDEDDWFFNNYSNWRSGYASCCFHAKFLFWMGCLRYWVYPI